MHELGFITETQHAAALKEPLVVKRELAATPSTPSMSPKWRAR
jgi:hypothetical protein